MSDKKETKMKKNFTNQMRENPWILSTLVLGVIALVLLVGNFSCTGNSISVSENDAGKIVLDFANTQVEDAELVGVEQESGLYKVTLNLEERDVPVYLTMDGENLVSGLTPLSLLEEQTQNQVQQTTQQTKIYTEEDKIKILEFSECLRDKGVKAYGAGWCGYCKKLKETFGGEAQVEPFYIECQNADRTPTEHSETCTEEEIRGFPTIKLNGEASKLSALSSLEDFAQETGCVVPELSN